MPTSSSTQLSSKLGVRDESVVALIHAPNSFTINLPVGATVRRRRGGHVDVVLAFFQRSARLDGQLDDLASMVFPYGSLWVAWPKRTSGPATDVNDHVARKAALSRGLVDNKVCAIDATWTALRLVWRRSARDGAGTDRVGGPCASS